MNLDYIEDLIYKENIILLDTYLQNTPGVYAKNNKINIIFYDHSKLSSNIEKGQVLIEELAHYYMDATYKFNSDITLINKQEYRAKKWAYSILIPYEGLKLAILKRN